MMKFLHALGCLFTLAIGITTTLWSHAAEENALQLNFGVYSHSKPSKIVRDYTLVLNELETLISAKLDRDVEINIKISNEFDQSLAELNARAVDFSRLYPSAYIEATKMDEGIKILARQREPDSHAFDGILAAKSGSDSLKLGDAWVARKNLDPLIFEALQLSLLELDSEDTKKKLNFNGFSNGDDTDYAAIREATDLTDRIFEESNAFDDPSIVIAKQPAANQPSLAAALPMEPANVVSAVQQVDANRAAKAMATQSIAIRTNTAAPRTATTQDLTPFITTSDDSTITINFSLPKHLLTAKDSQGNSKNITINLSVPETVN